MEEERRFSGFEVSNVIHRLYESWSSSDLPLLLGLILVSKRPKGQVLKDSSSVFFQEHVDQPDMKA